MTLSPRIASCSSSSLRPTCIALPGGLEGVSTSLGRLKYMYPSSSVCRRTILRWKELLIEVGTALGRSAVAAT